MEHGVQANGLLKENVPEDETEAFRTFFQEVPTGQFVPRAVSIDLEPTVIGKSQSVKMELLYYYYLR